MSKDSRKINATRSYRLFQRSDDNRPLDIKKHRKLKESMEKYGFIPSFPIVCYRNGSKQLIVKDGQHRLAVAETLGLPVFYVEETIDFDIAEINSTSKNWVLRDYAQKFAANGISSYQEGLEFADQYQMSIGTAFSLLAGHTGFTNVQAQFISGTFKIKDRDWASRVANLFRPMVLLSSALNKKQFLDACMAVCRVSEFDPKRMLHNAERCREKLVAYSTRDAYLDLLEEVYNFGRQKLVPLKILATMAMRERNPANRHKGGSQGKDSD